MHKMPFSYASDQQNVSGGEAVKRKNRLDQIFSVIELLLLIVISVNLIATSKSKLLRHSSSIHVVNEESKEVTGDPVCDHEAEITAVLDTSKIQTQLFDEFVDRIGGILNNLESMINETTRDIKDKISFLTYGEIVTLACIIKKELSIYPVYTCDALKNETRSLTSSKNKTIDQQLLIYLYMISTIFPSISHKDYETYHNIALKGIPRCEECAAIIFCSKKNLGSDVANVIIDPYLTNSLPRYSITTLSHRENNASHVQEAITYRNVLPLIPCFHMF